MDNRLEPLQIARSGGGGGWTGKIFEKRLHPRIDIFRPSVIPIDIGKTRQDKEQPR
jgi:hypothetical protein